ncbi:unnamed protein product [Moneuplotes crassus]|uniref:Uncharacterized protein n=1 Tax=Euplotes crassus TaxID=5936 RepID=A0AAD1X9T3_EUPCR|nr:unnamed protein product [Moneuplotes crassus]
MYQKRTLNGIPCKMNRVNHQFENIAMSVFTGSNKNLALKEREKEKQAVGYGLIQPNLAFRALEAKSTYIPVDDVHYKRRAIEGVAEAEIKRLIHSDLNHGGLEVFEDEKLIKQASTPVVRQNSLKRINFHNLGIPKINLGPRRPSQSSYTTLKINMEKRKNKKAEKIEKEVKKIVDKKTTDLLNKSSKKKFTKRLENPNSSRLGKPNSSLALEISNFKNKSMIEEEIRKALLELEEPEEVAPKTTRNKHSNCTCCNNVELQMLKRRTNMKRFNRMRIKPKGELSARQYALNELFHKIMTMKSIQTIRNKDMINDTVKKLAGEIQYENTTDFASILRMEEQEMLENKTRARSVNISDVLYKFQQPEKLFRRRLALSIDPKDTKDEYLKDEDKSYLSVKYTKENQYIKNTREEMSCSSFKDQELPKILKVPKSSENVKNLGKLNSIIKKCSSLLKKKAKLKLRNMVDQAENYARTQEYELHKRIRTVRAVNKELDHLQPLAPKEHSSSK